MNVTSARKIHFVGIGGAGMSAIAKVLIERGRDVSGSDLKRSPAFTVLEAMGARVAIGHAVGNLDHPDVVVVSSAIPRDNVEVKQARALSIPIVTRGEALAHVVGAHHAVAVAGTHGKTTTTSMIVSVLRAAGRDPTYLVGGGLNDAGTNARYGRDDLVVAESDESDGSFLLLCPNVAVVTNVEGDHLEHWGSLEALREAFRSFVSGVRDGGRTVLPSKHDGLADAAVDPITFGDGGDVCATDVFPQPDGISFTLRAGATSTQVVLRVPGRHNVDNALAAATAALVLGLELDEIGQGLATYRGVERRFHVRGESGGVTVIDDYAHHPTEVRATLAAARSTRRWRRITAVFQPHRYSRTLALSAQFGEAFADADRIVVTDVYGAGEAPLPGVTGKVIADAVSARVPGRALAYLPHRDELLRYLTRTARPGDALLTLGAGDISSLGEELLDHLRT